MNKRHFTFIVSSARRDGNTEWLARKAAENLPGDIAQQWLHWQICRCRLSRISGIR